MVDVCNLCFLTIIVSSMRLATVHDREWPAPLQMSASGVCLAKPHLRILKCDFAIASIWANDVFAIAVLLRTLVNHNRCP